MSSSQLNWKRLSSQLGKPSSNKVTKPKVKNALKKGIAGKQTLIKITKGEPKRQVSVSANTSSKIKSALDKDEETKGSDVLNSKYTLTPQGTDDRKQAPGRFLAMDCEFVGVGPNGVESALARVSIVNFHGHTIYDKFVKPRERVTDWRTWVSGVTPKHMSSAVSFETAQLEVSKLLDKKVLIGHAVHHDLDSLFLSHPKSMIRDTSQFQPYRAIAGGKSPSLKKLAMHFLQIDIQGASHSSVEDARATMLLYKLNKHAFEQQIRQNFNTRK